MSNQELLDRIYHLDCEETQLEILDIIQTKMNKKESDKSQCNFDYNGDMKVKSDICVFE